MSSFLCFICHSTVNSDTNEEIREKYREVIGMNLSPDSLLCHICCHVLNKLWLFKSICLKRSLEYPVLFSEKGTLNLQRNDFETHTLCPEENCQQHFNRNINSKSYYVVDEHFDNNCETQHNYNSEKNQYVALEQERNNFNEYLNSEIPTFDNFVIENNNNKKDFVENNEEELSNNHSEFVENDEYSNNSQNNDEDIVSFDDSRDVFHENNQELEHLQSHGKENYLNETDNITDDFGRHNVNNLENQNLETIDNKDLLNQDLYKQDAEFNTNELNEDGAIEKKKKRKKKKTFKKIILSLEEQKTELESRRKEKKYIEAEFKCYSCALGFLFKDTYQAHMMRHEESNGEHRCATCTLRFATLTVLRSHVALHAERYTCARCGLCCKPHSRAQHSRTCWMKQEDDDVASCHLCARMFKDSAGLQQHLKRFHRSATSNRTYSCSVCGKRYNNQGAVRTHMITHINRKFNCDQCSATFSSPYTLNQHKKKHNAGEDEQKHYCVTCAIGFNSRKSLLAHKRNTLAHQQTAYECPICGRLSPNQRSLTSHIETVHSGAKNHACAQCGARYSGRKALTRHMRVHTGRPEAAVAVCHLCGGRFKGNNKLNRHLRQVCEKAKLEEQLSSLYEHDQGV